MLPLLGLLLISVGSHLAGCGHHRRPVGLDLRGDVPPEVAAEASAYRAAGLPLLPGPVYVRWVPSLDPQVSGEGSRCYMEGDKLWVQLDSADALPHELTHAWQWRVLGNADGEHLCAPWAHPLLWPPGSRRPPWVVALIGAGS